MRLKSVEISGFKSFVDRTVFTFEDPISAIVGPNGCGKSNVVDAIKWAMGEQSAKQLRGRAMEDVIFAGSESRKPVGMAQVTLVFDNTDGLAPPQFAQYAEISVTRRLFRSGESEYLINKTPVRLRDVVDLFMGTGVGRRAYSVIEQEQIGHILTSKPEERRVLIEEAAGITKYKARKEEALRRVKSTEEDLVRVADKIFEIRRNLNSLNRAAKKAERYRAIKDELRAIDLVLGALDFRSLEERLAEAERTLAALREEEERLAGTLARVEADRERHALDALSKEKEVRAAQEEVHRLDAVVRELEARAEALARDIEGAQAKERRAAEEIEGLRARLAAGDEETAQARARLAACEAQAEAEERDLAEKSRALAEVRARHENLAAGIEREKGALIDVLTGIASARRALDAVDERRNEIAYRRTKAAEEIGAWMDRIETLDQDLARLRGQQVTVEHSHRELLAQREERAAKLSQVREENQARRRRYEELRGEVGGKRARLDGLREMVASLEGFGKGTRNILLGDEGRPRLAGIHGVMADVLQIDPRYETALEAVLGERLQTILVEDQARGLGAIEFLKHESEGRGTFLPLAQARGAGDPGFPELALQEAIAPMAELVRCPEPYAPVVRGLLADVLVVEDLEKAVRIHNANGYRGSLVTLDGEVLDSAGLMSGGSQESVAGGVLQRRREVRELEAEVAALSAEFERAQDVYHKGEGLAASIEVRLAELDAKLREEERRLVNGQGAIDRVAAEAEQAREQERRLREEAEALDREDQEHARRQEESRGRIEELEGRRARLAAEVSTREEEARALAREVEDLARLSTESRIAIAGFREKAAGLRATLAQMERAAAEMGEAIARREEDIRLARAEAARLAEEREALSRRVDEEIARRGEAQGKATALLNEHEALLATIREAEAQARRLRQEQDDLRERTHREDLTLQEVRMNLAHLAGEVRERYHLDLSEVAPAVLAGRIPVEKAPPLRPLRLYDESEEDAVPDGPGAPEPLPAPEPQPIEWAELPPHLVPGDGRFSREVLAERQRTLRERIEAMGEVNPGAIREFQEESERFEFFTKQKADLEESIAKLRSAIARINQTCRHRFQETFQAVAAKFHEIVPLLFVGGRGELRLVGEEEDVLERGVEIVIRPIGKRLQTMTLLSGGEKALASIALVFAIFLHKPTPFALLDEVDAPLDDQNVGRFTALLREMSRVARFIVITHNKNTMEAAGTLYGITMEEPGVSRQVSVRFGDETAQAV